MSHISGICSNFLSSKLLFSAINLAQLQSIELRNEKVTNQIIENKLDTIDDEFLLLLAKIDTNLYVDIENTIITCAGIISFIQVMFDYLLFSQFRYS